jgi:hypothetical protein
MDLDELLAGEFADTCSMEETCPTRRGYLGPSARLYNLRERPRSAPAFSQVGCHQGLCGLKHLQHVVNLRVLWSGSSRRRQN